MDFYYFQSTHPFRIGGTRNLDYSIFRGYFWKEQDIENLIQEEDEKLRGMNGEVLKEPSLENSVQETRERDSSKVALK